LTSETSHPYDRPVFRPVAAASLRPGSRLPSIAIALLFATSCSNPDRTLSSKGIAPAYDPATGKLTELAYDSNHNGRIDTWTAMDGARPLLTRVDTNEDGKLDRWEYYDAKSNLLKVGFSRADDGHANAWAFAGSDGSVSRIEISSVSDEKKIDRWEHYDTGGIASAEEDTDHNGIADKWESYESGIVKSAAFDENGDGKPDRRLTYSAGVLVTIESEPDASGVFTKILEIKPPSPAALSRFP
jgi:hypothetical protein